MSPAMLRQLRCRRNAAGEYQRPSESTVRRLLQKIPVESHFPHICERISANFPAGRPEREGYSGVLSSMSF